MTISRSFLLLLLFCQLFSYIEMNFHCVILQSIINQSSIFFPVQLCPGLARKTFMMFSENKNLPPTRTFCLIAVQKRCTVCYPTVPRPPVSTAYSISCFTQIHAFNQLPYYSSLNTQRIIRFHSCELTDAGMHSDERGSLG